MCRLKYSNRCPALPVDVHGRPFGPSPPTRCLPVVGFPFGGAFLAVAAQRDQVLVLISGSEPLPFVTMVRFAYRLTVMLA